jgi:hypothetical protein
MSGVTRTLLRYNGLGRTMSPIEVIGKMDLLPTMMDEGIARLGGRKREMLLGSGGSSHQSQ